MPVRGVNRLTRWGRSAWFAYSTIALLQVKVAWGAWRLKDLTFGDTCAYYLYATFWTSARKVNIAWSPLYSVFYGTVLESVGDVYAATILHRLLIALGAGLLVLALMRRLLPAQVAWLVAAWWTVLPVNFETVYEVHLFALLPIIAAWWMVALWPGCWGRGVGLGILWAAVVLSRNEVLFPAAVVGIGAIAWDLRRASRGGTSRRQVLLAYAIPVVAAASLWIVFYARSVTQFPALWTAYQPKHTVNMCQVYAAGYLQRHPEWARNPMTDCAEVMVRSFGEPYPTLGRMWHRNPRAVLEHFWWNLRLAPSGIQVLLFNATSSGMNPDYFPVHERSRLALLGSVLAALVLLPGLGTLWRDRRRWWRLWLRPRAATWLFMGGTVVPHCLVIILTQRPRPSYLFDLSVFLMGMVGMCAWVLCERLGWRRSPQWIFVPMVSALIVVVPSHYKGDPTTSRPLLQSYRRLAPFATLIGRSDAVLLVSRYPVELAHYIGGNRPSALDYGQIAVDSDETMEASLNQRGVNLFYVDESLIARLPPSALFVDRLRGTRTAAWELLAFEDRPDARWRLWGRRTFLEAQGS